MKIHISRKDIMPFLISCTWSGSTEKAARKLSFSYVENSEIKIANGMTVYGYDDQNVLVFQGNIYDVLYDSKKRCVNVVAFDHLWVLNRSRTTRKFKKALPSNIVQQIAGEMGVKIGQIKDIKKPASFIANHETGYQIIQRAYKGVDKKYHFIMNEDRLDLIEQGTLIENFIADSTKNMLQSTYKESIENLINQVLIVDEEGNTIKTLKDKASIKQHSMFQDIYKENPNKDSNQEAKKLFVKPDKSGSIILLGDYRVKSGYAITIKDKLFQGIFCVKSDTHTFIDDKHEMRLELELELELEEKA